MITMTTYIASLALMYFTCGAIVGLFMSTLLKDVEGMEETSSTFVFIICLVAFPIVMWFLGSVVKKHGGLK